MKRELAMVNLGVIFGALLMIALVLAPFAHAGDIDGFHIVTKIDVATLKTPLFGRNRIVYEPVKSITDAKVRACLASGLNEARQALASPENVAILKAFHVNDVEVDVHDSREIERLEKSPDDRDNVWDARSDRIWGGASILFEWWMPSEMQQNTLHLDVVVSDWQGDNCLGPYNNNVMEDLSERSAYADDIRRAKEVRVRTVAAIDGRNRAVAVDAVSSAR